MAGIRYRVLDLPTIGASAFTPTATMPPPASSFGLVKVTGSPGTLPVPVHPPLEAIPPTSADRKTQPSNCAPDIILPAIYIPETTNMGPSFFVNMALRRRNPLPVPATMVVRLANSANRKARIGGRIESTNWPRAFQRYNKNQTVK